MVALDMLKTHFASGIPKVLNEPLLIGNNLLPRYWASIWTAMSMGDLSHNTRIAKLRHIEDFYRFAEQLNGDGALDDALGLPNYELLSGILESYFVSLRNKPNRTAADEAKWRTVYEFATSVISWLPPDRTKGTLIEALKRIQNLSTLYNQLHVQGAQKQEMLRALPANVVQKLYEILDPDSALNPFKRLKTRWMMFVAFIMLLHQGLRRGELLLQPVNAVKSAIDLKTGSTRYWLNITDADEEVEDPRASRPSIKTGASLRQLPVSELTARIIQTYTENYRGKANHPFLLNSAKDTPLSMEALSVLFNRLSEAIPKETVKELEDRTGKSTVTAHDLRHTCAVVRLNQLLNSGVEMNLAMQKLRTFFGWSRTSDMPRKYARAVFEDRLAGIWSNVLDDRVSILNAIPKSK